MEMSFFLRARRRMACGFALALALSGPVVAAPPAIPISYTEALQRALANAPTLIRPVSAGAASGVRELSW